MIDFSNKYGNSISYYGISSFWQGIAKPKQVAVVASNFNFYGQLVFFDTWIAKPSSTPPGNKARFRTLMGVGV